MPRVRGRKNSFSEELLWHCKFTSFLFSKDCPLWHPRVCIVWSFLNERMLRPSLISNRTGENTHSFEDYWVWKAQSRPLIFSSIWKLCHCSRVWNLNSTKNRKREGERNIHQHEELAESSSQMLRDTSVMPNRMRKPSLISCSLFYQRSPHPHQKANLQICGVFITILLFWKHGIWQATKPGEVVLRKRVSPFTRRCDGGSSSEEAPRRELTVNSEGITRAADRPGTSFALGLHS